MYTVYTCISLTAKLFQEPEQPVCREVSDRFEIARREKKRGPASTERLR